MAKKQVEVVQLTLMAQIELTDGGKYEAKRDKLLNKLEKMGFSVNVESEDDYGVTDEV